MLCIKDVLPLCVSFLSILTRFTPELQTEMHFVFLEGKYGSLISQC